MWKNDTVEKHYFGSTKANNFLAQWLGFQEALSELEFASALPLGNCVPDFHVASGHKQVTPKWDDVWSLEETAVGQM